MKDPEGHSYLPPGTSPAIPERPSPEHWLASHEYLYGVDLYNHAYWWEAHEAWEGLWHAAGRTGIQAAYFKGLIKSAAAHLKVAQEELAGARAHVVQTLEDLRSVAESLGRGERAYMGLDVRRFEALMRGYYKPLLEEMRPPDRSAEFPKIILWP